MIKRLGAVLCVACLCLGLGSVGFAVDDHGGYEILPDVGVGLLEQSAVSTYELAPVGPDDRSGLVKLVLGIIGEYDPIVAEYSYQGNNGYTQYVREIQPDYVWIISAGVFVLLLYCVFRLWGVFLSSL